MIGVAVGMAWFVAMLILAALVATIEKTLTGARETAPSGGFVVIVVVAMLTLGTAVGTIATLNWIKRRRRRQPAGRRSVNEPPGSRRGT